MKSLFIKSLIAGTALLLVTAYGCGGANLGGNTNLFFGSFVGSYTTNATPPTEGTVAPFNVDVNGNVTGTITQNGQSVATATITGTVTATSATEGTFSGVFTPQQGGAAVNVSNGNFTWVTTGNASTLDVTFPVNTTTYSLVLLPQPTGKTRPH